MAYGTVNTDIVADSSGGRLAPISSVFRNRIINGAMVIDQRNAGASVTPTTSNQYVLDRWSYYLSVASKFSVQQNAGSVTPPSGFTKYIGITSLAATSLSAGDYYAQCQSIEGYNIADLNWGTANAKTVTLSFQVYSSLTGTFGGSLRNGAGNRSYPFTYTISSANTWATISVTIAGDTSGTWASDNSAGLLVFFGLGVGSTYSGTAGSWASSLYLSATGATSVVGTSGATFYITGIQLERGSSATGFEYRQYGQELALCQRYYYRRKFPSDGYGIACFGQADSMSLNLNFPVTMRSAPTMATNIVDSQYLSSGSVTAGQWQLTSPGVAAANKTGTTNVGFPVGATTEGASFNCWGASFSRQSVSLVSGASNYFEASSEL